MPRSKPAGRAVLPAETAAHGPVSLSYTGGTTGSPKGVLHTQRSLHCIVENFMSALRVEPTDVCSLITPMFHAASLGSALGAFTRGASVALVPLFTPAGTLELVERTRVTVLAAVPTMYRMVLDDPTYSPARFSSVRELAYGGSPMPRGLLDRLLADMAGVDIVQGYGMTEGLFVSVLSAEDHRAGGARCASAGRPTPDVQVRIVTDDGHEAPVGTAGEVLVRGAIFMDGYWRLPEATAAALAGGWYHTGDVGYLDADGYLFLVDRAKDMIVTGGENVYSTEVESALSTHPAVADVAVIAIPSKRWGEAVVTSGWDELIGRPPGAGRRTGPAPASPAVEVSGAVRPRSWPRRRRRRRGGGS